MIASQATRLQIEEDRSRAESPAQSIEETGEGMGEGTAPADCAQTALPGVSDVERVVAFDSALFKEGVEKKRLETLILQAQRMESVGALASALAHDLSSALAPILMGLRALQQKRQDEESRRWLALMHKSANRSKDLLERVLAFARGAEGEYVPLRSIELIEDIAGILKETLPQNIRLQVRVPNDLWNVIGDATQIGQILMNLCINARDAMPSGGKLMIRAGNRYLIEEEKRMARGGPHQRYVRITVADTGGGIPREFIDRVFDPFFTTKEKGTGLGLPTVLAIVRAHGGFVSLFSKVGKGTEFKVYLPAQDPDAATKPGQPGFVRPIAKDATARGE
ncbi:MAG TPA: ATP-binding protein [Blastocatellia bacterium]